MFPQRKIKLSIKILHFFLNYIDKDLALLLDEWHFELQFEQQAVFCLYPIIRWWSMYIKLALYAWKGKLILSFGDSYVYKGFKTNRSLYVFSLEVLWKGLDWELQFICGIIGMYYIEIHPKEIKWRSKLWSNFVSLSWLLCTRIDRFTFSAYGSEVCLLVRSGRCFGKWRIGDSYVAIHHPKYIHLYFKFTCSSHVGNALDIQRWCYNLWNLLDSMIGPHVFYWM